MAAGAPSSAALFPTSPSYALVPAVVTTSVDPAASSREVRAQG